MLKSVIRKSKNTVIRANSNVPHFNYVGDSYLGKNVNLGAGAKTANLKKQRPNCQDDG